MNTASRMESNGVAGRIHVSQATADELLARGRQGWISPREDKIVAKGKGELQTYFVSPTSREGSVISGAISNEHTDCDDEMECNSEEATQFEGHHLEI